MAQWEKCLIRSKPNSDSKSFHIYDMIAFSDPTAGSHWIPGPKATCPRDYDSWLHWLPCDFYIVPPSSWSAGYLQGTLPRIFDPQGSTHRAWVIAEEGLQLVWSLSGVRTVLRSIKIYRRTSWKISPAIYSSNLIFDGLHVSRMILPIHSCQYTLPFLYAAWETY